MFLDHKAWSIFLSIASEHAFDRIIINGDIGDFPSVSEHKSKIELHNPGVLAGYTIYEELNQIEKFITAPLRKATKARIIYRLGNHDMRLLKPSKSNSSATAEILELQNRLGKQKFHEILNLPKYNIEMSYNAQDIMYKTFTVIHGVKTAAGAAKANLIRYGSGTSGHSHRSNNYTQKMYGGVGGWWESGCMRTVENIEYLPHGDSADWSQAFLTLYIHRRTGTFFCKTHFIVGYKCEFNGSLFTA